MFSLIPNDVTSERSIALLSAHTLVWWWEWLRQRRGDGKTGIVLVSMLLMGAMEVQKRIAWETLLEMEGCAAEQLQTITDTFPGSKWSCQLLHMVLQDALRRIRF